MSPRKPRTTSPIPTSEADVETMQAQADKAAQAAEAVEEEATAQEASAQETENKRTKATQRDYEPHYFRPGKRRPAEDRGGAFNKLAWLVDGATGLVEELRHSDLGLSEDFWVHVYAMRREGLLAARAAIDSLLEKSEESAKAAEEKEERKKRRGSVSVDF